MNVPIYVLDIGCGKKSYLDKIDKKLFDYILYGMDISDDELRGNSFVDVKINYDACNDNFEKDLINLKGKFDLIVSHGALEHIKDTSVTYRMVNYLLKDYGFAIHSFPTLYDPILFFANIIPTRLSTYILLKLEPFRAKGGKFKTYYHNCRAYSRGVKKMYNKFGFDVKEWKNFYGTTYLYSIFPLQAFMDLFYLAVSILENKKLTSFHCIVLSKRQGFQ